jgi:NADH-quinone oxidoreductase subunit L
LIVLIPLLGSILNGLFGKRLGKTFVGFVAVLAPALAFVLGLVLWFRMSDLEAAHNHAAAVLQFNLGEWIAFAGFSSNWTFVLDRLSTVMVLVITGVGSLIHVYSTGYMSHEDDGGYARYFTYLNLFVASMLVLVLAGDLLVMFIGWEGVGMCSYLLIGFDYRDSDNAACGSKAFIVNRVGDFGFVLGMLTLLIVMRDQAAGSALEAVTFGLDITTLNTFFAHTSGAHSPGVSELQGIACLLLFVGATGKSAQLPLHLWLPDAMAGPTPVSALIHAATMVTAGVYMICRLSGVFVGAEVFGVPVLGIVALVGVLTAFYAGTSALAQDDIKKVLAYSTVSQLGYMFIGVGAGAFGMAVFHLVTHAFFKALLFLGAGSVIHATHTQSMSEMGGLRKYMPWTYRTMVIGALALAGLAPFSGFFSKDAILGEVLVRSKYAGSLGGVWLFIYALGLITAAITAIYSIRLILLTFHGEYRGKGHPHESPPAMREPLAVLAFLAIAGAFLGLPADIAFGVQPELLPHWLQTHGGPLGYVVSGRPGETAVHSAHLMGLGLGFAVGVLGVIAAWTTWNRPPAEVAWEHPTGLMQTVKAFLAKAWAYDEVLNKKIIQPGTKDLSRVLWKYVDDKTIDGGLVDGTGRVGLELSNLVRALQTGRVARYAGYFALGAIVLPLLAVVLSAMGGAGH